MATKVFISHSHKDKPFVRQLAERLAAKKLDVWVDEAELSLGDSLVQTITKAVTSVDYFLVVMSPDYFASTWAGRELDFALHSELEKRKEVTVVPILYRDCEIPPLLQDKLYADFRTADSADDAFPRLLALLTDKPIDLITAEHDVRFGQRPESSTKSADLAQQIEELRKQVEAFVGTSTPEQEPEDQRTEEVDPKLCFIVMPFGSEELNDVYEYFVKPTIESKCSLRCERGDDVFGSNVIMDDIRRSIENARLVIADLTDRNPNVFYEVGIAHTLRKDVLLLSQKMGDVPFDLRHLRALVYDYTQKG